MVKGSLSISLLSAHFVFFSRILRNLGHSRLRGVDVLSHLGTNVGARFVSFRIAEKCGARHGGVGATAALVDGSLDFSGPPAKLLTAARSAKVLTRDGAAW